MDFDKRGRGLKTFYDFCRFVKLCLERRCPQSTKAEKFEASWDGQEKGGLTWFWNGLTSQLAVLP